MTVIKTLSDISTLKESFDVECKLGQGRDDKQAGSGLPSIKQGWTAKGFRQKKAEVKP